MWILAADNAIKLDWSAVLVTIAVGLAGLVAVFFNGMKEYLEDCFSHATSRIHIQAGYDELERLSRLYVEMEEFRRMPFVDRVLIFRGGNGTGIPEKGKKYVIFCIYGWAQNIDLKPKDTYDFNLRVDDQWKSVLGDVIKSGGSLVTTAELPPGSGARRYYAREGVIQCSLHFLSMRNNKLIYLSCGAFREPFTAEQLDQIGIVANRLRAIMEM